MILIDMQKQNFVQENAISTSKVKKVKKIKNKCDVYNMNVENYHNYIANGIIVKNCDSLRYAYSYDIIKTASIKTNINPYSRS